MRGKEIYERFVWFDERVRTKGYPNATRLSREFETSLKTAQRDIEFMRDRLNCPLVYDKSRKGYHYENDTFSLPLIHLSSGELSSLLIARRILQDISGDCISDELSQVIEKITSVLKSHVAKADVIDHAFSLQLIEYSPVPEDVFKKVLEGCLKQKTLAFRYRSPMNDDTQERAVDPYHLFNYMGTWHLIAHCHMRKNLRDFNLCRMSDIKLLDSSFTVRKGFDFGKYFGSAFGLYQGGSKRQVTLRFSPLKSRWVKGQIWHKDQKEKVLKDGSLELTFPVANYSEIMMEILRHGSEVEVIKPKSLRDLIKSEAKQTVKIY
ncbi:MAG TPA: WYL domain-containing protein [Thermodesulfovibrionales bacterium]|nr:WYL domain-containing protein [Thermodesulfovibrionales bacterium]